MFLKRESNFNSSKVIYSQLHNDDAMRCIVDLNFVCLSLSDIITCIVISTPALTLLSFLKGQ